VSAAKTAEPISTPFWVWTWVGPGNHVLDEDAYWHNLVNATEPSVCAAVMWLYVKLLCKLLN